MFSYSLYSSLIYYVQLYKYISYVQHILDHTSCRTVYIQLGKDIAPHKIFINRYQHMTDRLMDRHRMTAYTMLA